ncbi:hypothetical protein BH23GEM2_BH23GEM2_22560 [soil metagenome]
MRRIPLAGLALGLILAGCDAGSPTGFEPQVEPQFAQQFGQQFGQRTVPFRGSCDLDIQPAEPLGPGVIRQVDVGRCQLAHLGRSILISDKVINLMAGTQTTDVAITAANGDILYGSGSGTNSVIAPGRVAFRVELTFTGGTGRFAGASGEAISEGEADLASGSSKLTMTGWLMY